MPKLRLGINIDHVATLRNARNPRALAHPDLLRAAKEAIQGGADSITIHLREDRRHILDDDVYRLIKRLPIPMNLEIAPTRAMRSVALKVRPYAVCLVPEKRQEITTEGGLDVRKGGFKLAWLVNDLASAGIRVSLFISPDLKQVAAAYATGAAAVEFHTGAYCLAEGKYQKIELKRLQLAVREAYRLGLEVHAGHGLTYENVGPIAALSSISELNIGHFLVGEAIFIGLTSSVRLMRQIIDKRKR